MVRGNKRALATKPVDVNLHASIHNRFDIEVVDAKTGKVKQRAQAENIILNSFWGKFLSDYPYMSAIAYGSGTTTPVATDTTLGAKIASVALPAFSGASSVITVDTNNAVISRKSKIVLSESTAVGANISEVGIEGHGNTLMTRALLKDMNGNPISIAKTNTDIINIYATVFVHYDKTGYGNKFYFDFTTKEAFSDSYAFGRWLLGNGCNIGGSWIPIDGSGNVSSSRTYDIPNKKITLAMSRLPANSGNDGLGKRWFRSYLEDACVFVGSDHQITGEAIGTGDGATTKYNTDFDLASAITVYVNGVAESGVITNGNPLNVANMAKYFHKIDSYGNILSVDARCIYNTSKDTYFYNPYYALGVKSITQSSPCRIYMSDDFVTWTQVATTNVPAELQYFRYYKIYDQSRYGVSLTIPCKDFDGNNIIFTTAPAIGAVITADYTTATVPKDVNHVFDFSMEIQLGEYTP